MRVCVCQVNGLFEASNDLFDEMEHQYRLRQYPIVSKMVNALPTVSTIGFVVAVLINLLLLVSVRVSPAGSLDIIPAAARNAATVANDTLASVCFAAGNVTDTLAFACAEAAPSDLDTEAVQIAAAGAVAFGDEVGLTVYPLGWLSGGNVLAIVHVLAFIHPFLSLLILLTYTISFAPLIVKAR